ncbi:Phosphatidylglycerol/phosphatidylinositol transfer protein [Mactra antiquata]
MIKIIIIATLCVFGYAKTVTFKDCGSVGGTINSVTVDPCDAEPCVLHHGTNISMGINFAAKENTTTAKTVVHGIIGGVPVPFPVPADCCANHNLECPVVAGTTVQYNNYVYCSPDYPKIRLAVKWEVQDDNGKDLFCFIVPVSIAD